MCVCCEICCIYFFVSEWVWFAAQWNSLARDTDVGFVANYYSPLHHDNNIADCLFLWAQLTRTFTTRHISHWDTYRIALIKLQILQNGGCTTPPWRNVCSSPTSSRMD